MYFICINKNLISYSLTFCGPNIRNLFQSCVDQSLVPIRLVKKHVIKQLYIVTTKPGLHDQIKANQDDERVYRNEAIGIDSAIS